MIRASLPRRILSACRLATLAGATLVAQPASAAEEGLVLVPEPILLGALLLLFVLLIAPLNSLIFRPLLRVLDAREERIAGTRRRAAKLEEQVEEILQRYERSVRSTRQESERERRALLDEVREEAQAATRSARLDAERKIEQARADVGTAFESARATLRGEAQTLAGEAASQVLGRPL